jgi:hypothetical protein
MPAVRTEQVLLLWCCERAMIVLVLQLEDYHYLGVTLLLLWSGWPLMWAIGAVGALVG